jgi:hypothetical protein
LAGGGVVETNAVYIGIGLEAARAGTDLERDGLGRCRHCSRIGRGGEPASTHFSWTVSRDSRLE